MFEAENQLPSEQIATERASRPHRDWHFAGPPVRILFVSTTNRARSQLAEALTRHLTHGEVEVFSAGSQPADEMHPEAALVISRLGHDTSSYVPKPLDPFLNQSFDRVVILQPREGEESPSFPGPSKVVSWDFADPIAIGTSAQEQQRAFKALSVELMARIRLLLTLIERERRDQFAAERENRSPSS